nr:hypothetical protein [Tanacetum cinerariifolium]
MPPTSLALSSFISDGANRQGARATGAAPGTRLIWNSTYRAGGIPVLEVVPPVLSFLMVPIDKVPVLQGQHLVPNRFGILLDELLEYPAILRGKLQESL